MKAVRRPGTGQASPAAKVALPQVPPGVGITPRTDPSQTILRPVQLRHVGGISIEDIPTEELPAIVLKEELPAIVLKEETKTHQKKGWVGPVVRTIVTVLLFAFLLRSMSWSTLVPTLMHVSHTYLLIGLAAGVLCIFFSAYGWR